MGRKVAIENLVGAYEIAKRLGLTNPHTVHVWRLRHNDFPEPVAKLKTALIWDWDDVLTWAKERDRK